MSGGWGNDDDPILSAALREPVPGTLLTSKVSGFGLGKNSASFSAEHSHSQPASRLGVIQRKVSQGSLHQQGRGAGQANTLVASAPIRTIIVPGTSLSVNQRREHPEKGMDTQFQNGKSPTHDVDFDQFESAGGRASHVSASHRSGNNTGNNSGLNIIKKTSTNYQDLQAVQEKNNSSKLSPTIPASAGKPNRHIQSLQPKDPARQEAASESTDLAYIGSNRNQQRTEVGSSNSALKTYGNPRRSTVPVEACDIQHRQAQSEFGLRNAEKSRQSKPFVSPQPAQAAANKRVTRRQSGAGAGTGAGARAASNEVIDLVDSDDDAVQCVGASNASSSSHAKLDSDILQLYGTLPGFSDERKRTIFGRTEDRVLVQRIYLGIYGFDGAGTRELYGEGEKWVEIEEIPFEQIKKILCGKCSRAEYGHEAYVVLSVKHSLVLNSIGVGPNCMLCPTLTKNSDDSCKYILIMCCNKALEALKSHLMRLPVVQQTRGFLTLLDRPMRSELEGYLYAHIHRDLHSRNELQERAKEERERKQKAERRRSRSKHSSADAAVDPTDCLTYTVYPIETEVLDAITIFRGDLKRLEPGEYLNDNLIDLKIKYLFRNMPEEQRARIHCFNCMFYTRLTAERAHEAGHALVSRWTKNVDIFSKDFILIPINYSYHWSLAVIVRPGALLADLESLQANLEDLASTPPSTQQGEGSAAKRAANKKGSNIGASSISDDVQDLTSTPGTPGSGGVMGEVMASASARKAQAPRTTKNDGVDGDALFEDDTGVPGKGAGAAAGSMDVVSEPDAPQDLRSGENSANHSDAEQDHKSPGKDNGASADAAAATALDKACILHMDSLGMHSAATIGKWLRSYLRLEWESRKRAELNADVEAKLAALIVTADAAPDSSSSTPASVKAAAGSVMRVDKIRKQLELRRKKAFDTISLIKCKVPMQANGHDCGLFVTRYAEMILKRLPSSSASILQNRFLTELPSNEFSQADVDKERANMRALIDRIQADWEALRREQKDTEADSDNADNNTANTNAAAVATSSEAPADVPVAGAASETANPCVGAGSSWVSDIQPIDSAALTSASGGTAHSSDEEDLGEDTGVAAEELGGYPVSSPAAAMLSVRHAAASSSSKFAHVLQPAAEDARPADTDFDKLFEAPPSPISQNLTFLTASTSSPTKQDSKKGKMKDSKSDKKGNKRKADSAPSSSSASASGSASEGEQGCPKRLRGSERDEGEEQKDSGTGDAEQQQREDQQLMDVSMSEEEMELSPAGHIDANEEMDLESPQPRSPAPVRHSTAHGAAPRQDFDSHSSSDDDSGSDSERGSGAAHSLSGSAAGRAAAHPSVPGKKAPTAAPAVAPAPPSSSSDGVPNAGKPQLLGGQGKGKPGKKDKQQGKVQPELVEDLGSAINDPAALFQLVTDSVSKGTNYNNSAETGDAPTAADLPPRKSKVHHHVTVTGRGSNSSYIGNSGSDFDKNGGSLEKGKHREKLLDGILKKVYK